MMARFRLIIGTIFSFEFLFILFLFAGVYKADPRFKWAPVDLTALFFVLSVIVAIIIFIRRGFRFERYSLLLVGVCLVFVMYVFASLAWTPGVVYARQKALYIATLTFWPLVATALIVANDSRRVKRFLLGLFIFSLWIAVESLIFFLKTKKFGFVTALGGEEGQGAYLILGRVLGLGTVIVFSYLLFFAKSWLTRILALLIFFFFFFDMLILGGKGPFFATVTALLIPLVMGWKINYKPSIRIKKYVLLIILLFLFIGGIIVYMFVAGKATVTLARIRVMVEPSMGESAGERLDYYIKSFQLWEEQPLVGHGIGSWPILLGIGDLRNYPHNIILEIIVELGLIGVLIFLSIVFLSVRALGKTKMLRENPFLILLLMLFINTIVNSMVSGDISDNRIVFAMLGILMFGKKREPYHD